MASFLASKEKQEQVKKEHKPIPMDGFKDSSKFRDYVQKSFNGDLLVEAISNEPFPSNAKFINVDISHGLNCFMNTVHFAFSNHHNLTLYPDQLWLLILQAIGTQVKTDPKKYGLKFMKNSSDFVSPEGELVKKKLIVRRDTFVKGDPKNHWEGVFPHFVKQMEIKDELSFSPNMTTSSVVSSVACDICLMDSLQNFFKYQVHTMCGIPHIKLEGIFEDYESILLRLPNLLSDLDLHDWNEALIFVFHNLLYHFDTKTYLDKYGDKMQEQIVKEPYKFFSSFYKFMSMSGTTEVTGWVNVFFPILKDGKLNPLCNLEYLMQMKSGKKNVRSKKVSVTDYPQAISTAPVTWVYFQQEFAYKFASGFMGTSICTDGSVTPAICWVIGPEGKKENQKEKMDWNKLF